VNHQAEVYHTGFFRRSDAHTHARELLYPDASREALTPPRRPPPNTRHKQLFARQRPGHRSPRPDRVVAQAPIHRTKPSALHAG
jgi:hypothetical protein